MDTMDENTSRNPLGDFGNVTNTTDTGETVPNKVLFVVIFCIFCLVGVIGNGSLMFLVIRFPNLRTMPNILMINLTFGDLLYIVATLPFIIQFELGIIPSFQTEGLCKFVQFMPGFAMGVCVYSMMALSVERYCAIVRGLEMRSMRTSIRVMGAMVFIWGMTFLVSSPLLISAGFLYPDLAPTVCTDMVNGPASIAYASINLTFMYILPMVTMGFCYTQIAIQLTKGARENTTNSRSSTHYEARKRLAIAMIIMAAFFGIFWFPSSVFKLYFEVNFWAIYEFEGLQAEVYQFFRRFSRVFAYTNSCFNPWILYFISTTHRRAIARCLCFCVNKNAEENGGYRMVRMRTNGRTVTTFHSYTSESGRNRTTIKPEDI